MAPIVRTQPLRLGGSKRRLVNAPTRATTVRGSQCAHVRAQADKPFRRPCGANELIDRVGMRCDRLLWPGGFDEVQLAVDRDDGGYHVVAWTTPLAVSRRVACGQW